jgi:hypothetical protein
MLIQLGTELCGESLKWSDVEPFIAQFHAADVDGSGRLSLLEALQCFARMKERLKNDERALGFMRHLFDTYAAHNTDPRTSSQQSPGLTKEQFVEHFGKPKVMERLNAYGIFGAMDAFWDFIEPRDDWLTVDTLQAGYLKFRDPKYGGDKAVIFLRNLFEQCDTDNSGELSKKEFMQILKMPKNIEKLHALGMSFNAESGTSESELEDALLLFFYELDVDFSGSISIDEMVHGFIRCRDECRMRQLESTGLAAYENIGITSPKAAPYLSQKLQR